MRTLQFLRIFSLAAYLVIGIAGQMIMLPMLFLLIFKLVDFWSIGQLFALLAIAGLIGNLFTIAWPRSKNVFLMDLLSFLCLLAPIIHLVIINGIWMFNYLFFEIPLLIFFVFHVGSLVLSFQQYCRGVEFRRD